MRMPKKSAGTTHHQRIENESLRDRFWGPIESELETHKDTFKLVAIGDTESLIFDQIAAFMVATSRS